MFLSLLGEARREHGPCALELGGEGWENSTGHRQAPLDPESPDAHSSSSGQWAHLPFPEERVRERDSAPNKGGDPPEQGRSVGWLGAKLRVWIYVLALPFTCCVALDKSPHLSEPLFFSSAK